MKEITAIIRMNKMNETKRALSDAGISSVTARDALGRGKGLVDMQLLKGAEQGYEEAISQLGQSGRLIPKRILLLTGFGSQTPWALQRILRSLQSWQRC